eukprot:Em0010g720a
MLGRKWKNPEDSEESFDIDTLPNIRNIRIALQQIEAQSLSLVVDMLMMEKEKGRMVTHASDSTTKKGVVQFIVQGLHVVQDCPYPLPNLSIHGETTEDIAMQVDMRMELVAAVRGMTVEEMYKLVDTHITDSTEHNKGFAELLAEMYNLEKPAGQLFCGTHTTLGFSSAMNKVVRMLEAEMKMDQVLKGFMVELEIDTKDSSLEGQALDMCLKLVAPEYSHKPWNRNKECIYFLEQRNLRDFYKDLHISLGKPISEQYTRFKIPEFSGVSKELFQGVKNKYKPEMLNSVSEMANEYMEDMVKLTNLMLPHLQQVLVRQRRDYGIDEETFPQQYPVEEQASNIDDTPVHNTGMERQCWVIGQQLWLKERWSSEQTKANFARESTEKQEMAQRQERKRLDMLNSLKSLTGPFTDAVEVVKYLAEPTLSEKVKQQRLKLEVEFAKESTTLLPKVDPLFRIPTQAA